MVDVVAVDGHDVAQHERDAHHDEQDGDNVVPQAHLPIWGFSNDKLKAALLCPGSEFTYDLTR